MRLRHHVRELGIAVFAVLRMQHFLISVRMFQRQLCTRTACTSAARLLARRVALHGVRHEVRRRCRASGCRAVAQAYVESQRFHGLACQSRRQRQMLIDRFGCTSPATLDRIGHVYVYVATRQQPQLTWPLRGDSMHGSSEAATSGRLEQGHHG